MARFEMTGIDAAIAAFDKESEAMRERAAAAAQAGGEVFRQALEAAAPVRTGQLAGSMVVKPGHNTADGHYVDVYPDGTRADGERNAVVGFVQEYGRSNMSPNPWMRPTLASAASAVTQAMIDVLKGGG